MPDWGCVAVFRNYVRDGSLTSPINLAVARFILGVYISWKVVSVRWTRIYEWEQTAGYHHANLGERSPEAYSTDMVVMLEPLVPEVVLANILYLEWMAVVVLLAFATGISVRYAAFVGSFLLCYLGVVHAMVDHSWSTQILPTAGIVLMFFALYAEQDHLSLAGVRRRTASETTELKHLLSTRPDDRHAATPLQLLLLGLAVLYFGSGLGKLVQSGLQWVAPWNLGRQMYSYIRPGFTGYSLELAAIVSQYEALLIFGAVATIVLEVGFLLAILVDELYDALIVGLLGMHVTIALIMGPVFLYTIVLLLLFLDWERILRAIASDKEATVYFDPDCRACLGPLYFFHHLDVDRKVTFTTSSINDKGARSGSSGLLSVCCEGEVYSGFAAFSYLCRRTGILYPLHLFCRLPLISLLGRRTFDHVVSEER